MCNLPSQEIGEMALRATKSGVKNLPYGGIVLTGEVKLPGNKDGATPYNAKLVKNARGKAQRAGA